MNIFSPQTSLKNYTYPVIKIIISVLIILICIFRKKLFNIETRWLNVLLSMICFIISIICIICIYISSYEIFNKFECSKQQSKDINNAQMINIEEIINLVKNNDIIKIKIIYKDELIHIGSSSNCKNGSNVFFDKMYYCGDHKFHSLNDFHKYVERYAINNLFLVVSKTG